MAAEKFLAFEKYDGEAAAASGLASFALLMNNAEYSLAKNNTVSDLAALGFTPADLLLTHDDPQPPEEPAQFIGPVIHRSADGGITEIDLLGTRRLLVNAHGDYFFADAEGKPLLNDDKEPYPVIPSNNVSITNGDVTIENYGKSDWVTYAADGREIERVYSSTRTWNPNDGTLTTVFDHVEGKPDVTDTQYPDRSWSHRVEDVDGSSTTTLEREDGSYTVTTITPDGHVLTFDRSSQGAYVWKRDGRPVQSADPTGDGNYATVLVTRPDGALMIYENVDITNIRADGSIVDSEGNNPLINGQRIGGHDLEMFG